MPVQYKLSDVIKDLIGMRKEAALFACKLIDIPVRIVSEGDRHFDTPPDTNAQRVNLVIIKGLVEEAYCG